MSIFMKNTEILISLLGSYQRALSKNDKLNGTIYMNTLLGI